MFRAEVDYAGSCGNMSSAIGPFALAEELAPAPAKGDATVRIHNANTGNIIVARFPVGGGGGADGSGAGSPSGRRVPGSVAHELARRGDQARPRADRPPVRFHPGGGRSDARR